MKLHPAMRVLAFVQHVKDACAKHDVTFEARRSKRVDSGDGVLCHGFFESDTRRLVVAAAGDVSTWLPVLVHEYGHMTQWLGRSERWAAAEDELFLQWLGGRRLSEARRIGSFSDARDMELDCERRSLRLIAKHGLPIDPRQYARTANAYIAFYRVACDYRCWYTKGPWEVPEVLAHCPDRIMPSSWHDYPPRPLQDAIVAHCLPRRARYVPYKAARR